VYLVKSRRSSATCKCEAICAEASDILSNVMKVIRLVLSSPTPFVLVKRFEWEDGQSEDGKLKDSQLADGQLEDGQREDSQLEDS
jgi:hypothetical protein